MADMEKNAEQTAAEKKAKKAAAKADSKQSGIKEKKEKKKLFARIAGWFKDLKKEFKRVVWPDRKKVLNNTLVVLCVVIVGSVLVGLIDTGLLRLMQYLLGLSNSQQVTRDTGRKNYVRSSKMVCHSHLFRL